MSVIKLSNVDIAITRGGIKIVEQISFEIQAGQILGLVGESGSGKTTVSMALLGHTRKGAVIESGSIGADGCGFSDFASSTCFRVFIRCFLVFFRRIIFGV